jgi:uncharacterized protein YyaL (SSP411 family)
LYGGFGTSQKFPYAEALLFLLQRYESSGDKAAWEMVDFTLRQMANGGVYDHVGGASTATPQTVHGGCLTSRRC